MTATDPRRLIASLRQTTPGNEALGALGRRVAIADDARERLARSSGFATRVPDGNERGAQITYDPATHVLTLAGQGYQHAALLSSTRGQGTITFTGSGNASVVLAHGLGRVPTSMQMTARGTGSLFFNLQALGAWNYDATNVEWAAQFMPGIGVISGTYDFTWECS